MKLLQPRSQRDDDRGSMLVVALGILTLLSILALTFVSLMRLEQTASTNYVDGVRARLIAEAGLELAMAQMKRTAGTEGFSDPNADWIYAQGNYWVPLEEATAIRRGEPGDSPTLNTIRASYAGGMGASYANGKDLYKIKVIDTQTQFNINSRFESLDGKDHVYIRWLDSLGVAISKLNPRARGGGTGTAGGGGGGRNPILHARFPKGSPNAFRGAEAIFRFRESREGKRFNSKTELLEVLENEDDYLLLRDYITDRSWFDPNSVAPRSQKLIGDSGNIDTIKPWSDVTNGRGAAVAADAAAERRSPINVNLAMPEVIAANLAGIAGRGIFLYTGKYDPTDTRRFYLKLDEIAGQKFEYATKTELRPGGYTPSPVLVYFTPLGYHDGAQVNDPPTIHGAIELAKMIKNRIQSNGPFKSFAEWEAWVDQYVTDGFLENTRDPDTSTYEFPRAQDALVFKLISNPPTADSAHTRHPEEAEIKAHPAFRPWFYDAVRSMIKANMNPNPRLSSWNPDAAFYLPVDKGNLLYPHDPANVTITNNSTKARRQTLEWCFQSKGIFEIISLGEVLGPVKNPDPAKPEEKLLFAQSKIRGVLQLFDTITHTNQRQFERKGEEYQLDPLNPNAHRVAMVSQPVPRIYWDPRALSVPLQQVSDMLAQGGGDTHLHAEELDGWLQISTRIKRQGVNYPPVVDMGGVTFEALWQDRRVCDPASGDPLHRDGLVADTAGSAAMNATPGRPTQGRPFNGWSWPFGSATQGVSPSTRSSTEQEAWRWDALTNDGYLSSELRRTSLWYRASDKNSATLAPQPDGRYRGESLTDLSTGGNVAPTPKGGVELWYKPEFDWAVRTTTGPTSAFVMQNGQPVPDGRYCGILATSHVCPNPSGFQGGQTPAPGSWTRGTQMFVTRTTEGDIRITRLFYEVVGPSGDPQEEPLVQDPTAAAGGGSYIKFSEYFQRAKSNQAYVWPPKELYSVAGTVFERIRWGRTDHWVPFQLLQEWRAHEWHHLAVYWDDYAEQENIKVWLDGVPVTTIVKRDWQPGVNDRYEPVLPDPRGVPPANPPIPFSQYASLAGTDPRTILPLALNGDGKMPAFVRLNAKTGPSTFAAPFTDQASWEETLWPKDQILVGGIRREQAAIGGLFKHDQDALLPSNGTVDDVRFYNAVATPSISEPAMRFEEEGQWVGEFDLSPYFPLTVDTITLGALTFTAYLPTYYGAEKFPNGRGSVLVSAQIVDRAGRPKMTFPTWQANFDALGSDKVCFPFFTDTGAPVTVVKGDRVVYTVLVTAATNARGYFVASPVVDDVSLVYFLPNSRILLQERVNQ